MRVKTIVCISIGGLLLWFLLTQPTAAPIPKENRVSEKQGTLAARSPHVHRIPDTLMDFQKTDFYRTIVDNNLFRPLGWTPPDPQPTYRLLGTLLPRSENTPPKAIIQSTAGNTLHIVTTGEQLDASTEVVSIGSKQVVLETDGKQRTLHLQIGF